MHKTKVKHGFLGSEKKALVNYSKACHTQSGIQQLKAVSNIEPLFLKDSS